MARHIHYFKTKPDFNEAYQNNYLEPWVSYTEEGEGVAYNKPDYTKIPFTIEALGSGDVNWAIGDKTVQYSKNGGSWETMNSATTISVVEGDEVQFKGTNTNYNGNTISATSQFNVKGNIMSLTDGDDFETADTVNTNGFYGLFNGCTYLVSASNLKLPATTLAYGCYYGMFQGCTSLTTAPELPATTLANNCYYQMFSGCTSLTTAPELPATTLSDNCYNRMFLDCTNLTQAPALPATTLATYCYYMMFCKCTNLTRSPELPATTLVQGCYYSMFDECTNLTQAPALPATTLISSCYNYMFRNCTNLAYIKAMFTTTPGNSYTYDWVKGVLSNGTFVKNSAATWTKTGTSGVPSGWTVETATE